MPRAIQESRPFHFNPLNFILKPVDEAHSMEGFRLWSQDFQEWLIMKVLFNYKEGSVIEGEKLNHLIFILNKLGHTNNEIPSRSNGHSKNNRPQV